jgi:predicted XRE-type DNA-binding protein
MKNEVTAITPGSGNVFADLGLPEPGVLLAKAALAHEIAGVVSQRGLTQTEIARILGTTQPSVSALLAGKLSGFSMDRLIRYLNALDRDVSIVVSPRGNANGPATVTVSGTDAAAHGRDMTEALAIAAASSREYRGALRGLAG